MSRFAFLALVASALVASAEPFSAEEIRRMLVTTPETISADGSLRVIATSHDDRSILLRYLGDLRDALDERVGTNLFQGVSYGILLRENKEAPAGPLRAAIRPYVPGQSVLPPVVVNFPDPASLDPRELASVLVDALLRLHVLSFRTDGQRRLPQPPPRWFSAGLARLLDPAARQADFDRTLARWPDDKPPAPSALLEEVARTGDPALAAQLVAFWFDRPDPFARLRRLDAFLGGGTPWSAPLFLETALGRTDASLAKKAFDDWIEDRKDRVLTPGVTTPEYAARIVRELRLVAGRDGVPPDYADGVPQPAERLLEQDNAAWAPATARLLEAKVLRAAAGRGDAFRAAAAHLAALFHAIGAGESTPDAATRIAEARRALLSSSNP